MGKGVPEGVPNNLILKLVSKILVTRVALNNILKTFIDIENNETGFNKYWCMLFEK